MKVTALALSLIGACTAFVPGAHIAPKTAIQATAKEDLTSLATELNPVINYYDPLQLADKEFWDGTNEATIGFLRHAEIKHGRVAMAAFVGYCVQSNAHFPWKMSK